MSVWIARVLSVLFVLAPMLVQAASTTVTSCGQVVTGKAVLAGDLDCSAYPGHALVLDGTLVLNGFTLTGNPISPGDYDTVACTGTCRVTIKGPGTIVSGTNAVEGGKVIVTKEVTIRDAANWGVRGTSVRILHSAIQNCGHGIAVAIFGGGGVTGETITVSRSSLDGHGSYGVNATTRATLRHVHVLGNPIADIRSFEKPTVVKTTCLSSRRESLIETWGVCAAD